MKNRIDYYTIAKDGVRHMLNMEKYLSGSTTLEKELVELVKIRASQINGCAFCIDVHTSDARDNGESEQRIYLLTTWRETNLYTEREKMALKLAESITLISDNHISDTLYKQSLQYFDEKEYVDLVLLINQINSWNRLSISMANPVAAR